MADDVLVSTENASSWLAMNSLNAGRDANFGRQTDFSSNPAASNAIGIAHKAVESAIETSRRLAKDTTRTVDARHEAAERFVTQAGNQVEAMAKVLEAEAKKSIEQAEDMVLEVFAPDSSNVLLQNRLHDHIHLLATTRDDGIQTIRSLAEGDKEVARILFTSRPYLLGINDGVLNSLRDHAIGVHVPQAQTLRQNAKMIAETAAKYGHHVREMHESLFNKAIAARARATRVDV